METILLLKKYPIQMGRFLEVNYQEGVIEIDGISGLLEQNASSYVQVESKPNPFRANTEITIECMRAIDAQVHVYNPVGVLCFNENVKLQQGTHELDIPESIFSQTGTYLLKIQGTDFISTYKLIAIQ